MTFNFSLVYFHSKCILPYHEAEFLNSPFKFPLHAQREVNYKSSDDYQNVAYVYLGWPHSASTVSWFSPLAAPAADREGWQVWRQKLSLPGLIQTLAVLVVFLNL